MVGASPLLSIPYIIGPIAQQCDLDEPESKGFSIHGTFITLSILAMALL